MPLYWTMHNLSAWEDAQQNGVMRNPLLPDDVDDFLIRPYIWMAAQMEVRIGEPPPSVHLPVWLCAQWPGATMPRPDLRGIRHWWNFEEDVAVQLEVELDKSLVLESDYDAWHTVLSQNYLPYDEADADEFQYGARSMSAIEHHAAASASWERVFELETLQASEYWNTGEQYVQACVWEIPMSAVKKVRKFKPNKRSGGKDE